MRQLIIKIPEGQQDKVHDLVKKYDGKNTINLKGEEGDVFYIYLPNKKVNDFLKEIDEFEKKAGDHTYSTWCDCVISPGI